MGEVTEFKESARELCDVFGILNDVKNERQLLNIIYFAQKQSMIEEIYSDFRFSDVGPFSPKIDFDLEILKMNDVLYETNDPNHTIYLTSKGKSECDSTIIKIHKPEIIESLKGLDIDELVDINRYFYLKERYDLKNNDFGKMKDFFKFDDSQIKKLKRNIIGLFFP